MAAPSRDQPRASRRPGGDRRGGGPRAHDSPGRSERVARSPAGLVHEIRNRLTTILGQAELLLLGADDPDKGRGRLQIIVKETSRAAGMLQNILQFSRRESTEGRPL